jgi:hypothetical protein
MFSILKKLFLKDKKSDDININENFDDITILTIEEIRDHFETVGHGKNKIGFEENTDLIKDIRNNIVEGRKNIFILDDVCDIVGILRDELTNSLRIANKLDKVNIHSLCNRSVGFDMLSILANHKDISVEYLITDITFGGNEKINGKKIIVDGIDVLIIAKNTLTIDEYVIFTGNILSESNVNSYNFAKKFEKYLGESILDHAIIKDSAINMDVSVDNLFGNIIKGL